MKLYDLWQYDIMHEDENETLSVMPAFFEQRESDATNTAKRNIHETNNNTIGKPRFTFGLKM
jgi:hypothetical protein